MKKPLYILFFITLGVNAQVVNMWTYDTANGGNNNGVIEGSEFQKSVDEQTNLNVDPLTTITLTTTVRIDQNQINTIDFNGSTITKNGHIGDWMIDIDKRNWANTLTTIKNLKLDCNDKTGSGIDIASRVHFENVEIYDLISNNANGVRNLIYNTAGAYGQWVFDNVDIHNLEPVSNDGIFGNDPGAAHGFLSAVIQIPSQTTEIVMINSDLYEIWGEDAGAITNFSSGLDISNTPVSFWFENVTVADAQRRAVKGFVGNQTFINSTFTSATYDDPNIIRTMPSAGLFVIGPGSSSTGATNNVICGCTFQGHPSDPFDSWYTRVIMTSDLGPSGLEISNSTFTGANPQSHPDNGFTAFGSNLKYLSIDNSTFGTQNGIRLVGAFSDYAYMSTNNTYVDGETTTFDRTTVSYTTPTIPFAACPTIGASPPASGITGLLFQASLTRFTYLDENTTDYTATLVPVTEETGQTFTYTKTGTGNDPGFFTITGDQIAFDNGSTYSPDYENPGDSNTNNIYALDVKVTASPSASEFTENMVFYVENLDDEGGEVLVDSIAFDDDNQTINFGETVDNSHTFNDGVTTPDNTGVSYSIEDVPSGPEKLSITGVGTYPGTTTYTIIADDNTNGTIQNTMSVTINPHALKSRLAVGKFRTSAGGGKIRIGL